MRSFHLLCTLCCSGANHAFGLRTSSRSNISSPECKGNTFGGGFTIKVLQQMIIAAAYFGKTFLQKHIKWFIFKHLIAGAMKIGWLKFKVPTI